MDGVLESSEPPHKALVSREGTVQGGPSFRSAPETQRVVGGRQEPLPLLHTSAYAVTVDVAYGSQQLLFWGC